MAVQEFDIGVAEALGMPVAVPHRDFQLLRRHVDADHPTGRTDQFRQQIAVAPGTAAQIQHGLAG